jgi:hypothetical protein
LPNGGAARQVERPAKLAVIGHIDRFDQHAAHATAGTSNTDLVKLGHDQMAPTRATVYSSGG